MCILFPCQRVAPKITASRSLKGEFKGSCPSRDPAALVPHRPQPLDFAVFQNWPVIVLLQDVDDGSRFWENFDDSLGDDMGARHRLADLDQPRRETGDVKVQIRTR